MQWWHQLVMDIRLNKRSIVVSWNDLKVCMRVRFVPPHHRKELLLKLQRLEFTLTKINMHESKESKITRFIGGLR